MDPRADEDQGAPALQLTEGRLHGGPVARALERDVEGLVDDVARGPRCDELVGLDGHGPEPLGERTPARVRLTDHDLRDAAGERGGDAERPDRPATGDEHPLTLPNTPARQPVERDCERLGERGFAHPDAIGDPQQPVLVRAHVLRERTVAVHRHPGRVATGAERRSPVAAVRALATSRARSTDDARHPQPSA